MSAQLDNVSAQLQACDDNIRIAALRMLTADDCMSPVVKAQLENAVHSPSTAIRVAAMRVWNRCGGGVESQIIASTFDRHDAVRFSAMQVVLEWKSADFVTYVRRGLRDRSINVRLLVLDFIQKSLDQISVEELYSCLEDAESSVAFKAAEILATHQDHVGIEWLFTRYHSPQFHIKKKTIRILGRARVAQFIPLLLNEIATRSDYMIPAIYALGIIADPDALPPLLVLICSPVLGVANAAITSLIRYQHPLVVTVMRQAVLDERNIVCRNAVKILAAHHFIPPINEAIPYLRYGEYGYINQLLQTYLHGDSVLIMSALTQLHMLNLLQGTEPYVKLIRNIIRNHQEFLTLVHLLLASSLPVFQGLGIICIDKTIIEKGIINDVIDVSKQPDFCAQEALQKFLNQLAISAPQTIIHYWDVLPVHAKEQCIKYVLIDPDPKIRAYAIHEIDATIRKRCIQLFCKLTSVQLCEILGQMSPEEIGFIATWQFDKYSNNQLMASEIIATIGQVRNRPT